MKIVILDYSTGDVDILKLDKEAEELFNSTDDATEILEKLGYNESSISWMVLDEGVIREYNTSVFEDKFVIV